MNSQRQTWKIKNGSVINKKQKAMLKYWTIPIQPCLTARNATNRTTMLWRTVISNLKKQRVR